MLTYNLWKEDLFYEDVITIFIQVVLTPICIIFDLILLPIEIIAFLIYKIKWKKIERYCKLSEGKNEQ